MQDPPPQDPASQIHHLRQFTQTHVILGILRVGWGGSVLQLLAPDPVNPLNPVTNSRLCKKHVFSQQKRALTPQNLHPVNLVMNSELCKKTYVFTIKASPDPQNHNLVKLVTNTKFSKHHMCSN